MREVIRETELRVLCELGVNIAGAVFCQIGGSYDTGSAGQFRLGATMTVRNGGSFATPKDQANYNSAGRLVVEKDGVVEIGTTATSREWTGVIPVSLSGGTMTVHGVFTSNAGDLYEGGELVMTREDDVLRGAFCIVAVRNLSSL